VLSLDTGELYFLIDENLSLAVLLLVWLFMAFQLFFYSCLVSWSANSRRKEKLCFSLKEQKTVQRWNELVKNPNTTGRHLSALNYSF